MKSSTAAALLSVTLAAGCQRSCATPKIYARDAAVQMSATVGAKPPKIALTWLPGLPNITKIEVFRRVPAESPVGWAAPVATLPPTATTWTDAVIAPATPYEYRVVRTHDGAPFESSATLYAGVELRLVERRGTVILVVDAAQAPKLGAQLARLGEDLVGDGWSVVRRDVPRDAPVTAVKAEIKRVYDADPAHVQAVFLIGHVPVPYSGNGTFDGHKFPQHGPIHVGAWPADLFYGEMNAAWTDTEVDTGKNTYPPARAANVNVPGDGKWDQTSVSPLGNSTDKDPAWRAPAFPNGEIELAVGRVDLADMPSFAPLGETELLIRYLDKDHAYRHKQWSGERRAVIDDHFDRAQPEDRKLADESLNRLAAGPWRSFSTFFGPANVAAGPLLRGAEGSPILFALGSAPGDYTECTSVAVTRDFAVKDPRVVFYVLQGSYFGDWDNTDNLLRAPLGTERYGLASMWGRPPWKLDQLATGATLGEITRLSQNASEHIHLALMGDPTLRLHTVAPPTALTAVVSDGDVKLNFTPSPEDGLLGYHVFRAGAPEGPYERISPEPFGAGEIVDTKRPPGRYHYMLRAVKMETSGSGSYVNASQGAFASVTVAP